MEGKILNFKASEHLKNAVEIAAKKVNLKPSKFMREVIKKHINYKEPEVKI
jgi:hypothetical protein